MKFPSAPVLKWIFLASLVLLYSCSAGNPRVSVLWTDIPDISWYVEVFNASQKDHQILLEFQPHPEEALLSKSGKPDLVIGRWLSSRKVKAVFSPLNFLFERAAVTREQFYPDFLYLGMEGENQLLMPVSFNVPIIVYKTRGSPPFSQSLAVELPALRQMAAAFNSPPDKPVRRMGFSPRWSPDFLWMLTTLQGSGWREGFSSELVWEESKLAASLDFVRGWIETDALGREKEAAFTQKYFIGNPFTLLEQDRILAYPFNLRDFMIQPEAMTSGLDFRYPSWEDNIAVEDDLVFAGIPSGSPSRASAEGFLAWFLREETQRGLLEKARVERLPSFGIAEGLSSLHRVNEKILPEQNPALIGRIPQLNYYLFPPPPPSQWSRLKSAAILPWLVSYTSGKSQDTLASVLEKWYLQQAGR